MLADALEMFEQQGFVIWPRPMEKGLLDSLVASVEAIQRHAQARTLDPALDELLVYEKDLPASKRAGGWCPYRKLDLHCWRSRPL